MNFAVPNSQVANSVVRFPQDATDGTPATAAKVAGVQLIPIGLIDVPQNRSRDLDREWVKVLAGMIVDAGVINPITVRPVGGRFQLITGLHRLSAAASLEWRGVNAIAARLSDAETDDEAKREEILENIGRNELNALDRAHHLYDLKHVYERLHPDARNGGDRRSAKAKNQNAIFAFCSVAPEETGLSRRAIEMSIAIWKGLSVESRRRCAGTWIASHQSSLIALSRETHSVQANVLDILLAENPEASTVGDALLILLNGRLLTHVEKKFDTLKKKLDGLEDAELEIVIAGQADRIIAALKRMGRI